MGTVYRAEHTVLGGPAAIKVLLPKFTTDASYVDRFFHEAKAASAIRHHGIVEVFDYGRLDNSQAYIIMELLRGEGLADVLARSGGKLPIPIAVLIAMQMLAALDAAHVVDVVHRDLKPDNIMLVADASAPAGIRVKILDFGIAKLLGQRGAARHKTRGGTILGTPSYMAPEQCKGGGEVTARADIYATGCILFEMLVGRPPFVGEGEGEVMAMHIYEPPPRLTAMDRTMPVELDALIAKMLHKSPEERVPSAAYALAALERITMPALPTFGLAVRDRGQHVVSLAMPAASARDAREGGGMPRWLPIVVLVLAIAIAVIAVFAIGSTGRSLSK